MDCGEFGQALSGTSNPLAHFLPQAAVSPFVGAGINFTRFFDVEERGPLRGTDLDLGDSWGFAVHAGVDFRISDRWLAGVDFRWIDIDTTARIRASSLFREDISLHLRVRRGLRKRLESSSPGMCS